MLRNRLYYSLKPFLPWSLRVALRRWRAHRRRRRYADTWPIDESAARPPEGWQGWPEGKQFAVVLTHDVEGQLGVDRCRLLMELEEQLGFRSSFNFIPEGEYRVAAELRAELAERGFEVGVHDLAHDGKLLSSREGFRARARRINAYLKDWGAVGFRAGFMLHNLDWFHDLDVQYDASTFDTDPFEPQPDAVGTIFPFWVPRPRSATGDPHDSTIQRFTRHSAARPPQDSALRNPPSAFGDGYVELPYTLPQDFTTFIVFRERTIDLWKRKLDWVAAHGGMVLVNVHPDYLAFDGQPPTAREFPAELYAQLLRYLKEAYSGRYWHALPKEVAAFARQARSNPQVLRPSASSQRPLRRRRERPTIWIDLENTPHIPFFKPIIRELEARGFPVVLTARDAYQTCEMASFYGLVFTRIGKHYGKHRWLKMWGLFVRGTQLLSFARAHRPALAVNHGSRSQNLVCNSLGISTVTFDDYEHGKSFSFLRPRWLIVPSVFDETSLHGHSTERVRRYSGIKEDVYVPDFKPDPSILQQLDLNGGKIIVTVRPPATEAHYHNPESEALFVHFMNRICAADGVRAILLPRNKRQEAEIRTQHPEWFVTARVKIPEQVVDGLNLMWHSDLVVSGGGTMNREAAALGVPVYSIFRGKIGAVDRHLQAEGRLTLIESVDDVDRKILLVPRTRASRPDAHPRKVLNEIVGYIEEAASAAMASYGRASSRTRTAERGLKPPVRAA